MFVVIARAATLDSALILCTTARGLGLCARDAGIVLERAAVANARPRHASAFEERQLPLARGQVWHSSRQGDLLVSAPCCPDRGGNSVADVLPLGVAVMVKGPLGVLLPDRGAGYVCLDQRDA